MNGDIEETLELLREAHREPIAEAHYAAVRARVVSRLRAERRTWWRIWAYGLAVTAVAAFLVGRTPRPARVPVDSQLAFPQQTHAVNERPTGRAAGDKGVRSADGRRTRLPHRREGAYRVIGPPALQPLVVKLVTNDPNVVIYWISGE